MSARVSAFELEVLRSAFETIADELAIIVMRTSCSSIVRDAIDYSTAICDAQGRTLAQGATTRLKAPTTSATKVSMALLGITRS